MFCYHCQEAKKNTVCDTAGICGKKANISSLQDMLMYSLKGLAFYCSHAEEFELVSLKTHRFMARALFSMATNVNFSAQDFVNLIDESVKRRNSIRDQFLTLFQKKNNQLFDQVLPEEAEWVYEQADEQLFTETGATVGVEKYAEELDADILGLQECLLYAAKGLGGLAVDKLELGIEDREQYRFICQILSFTLKHDNSIQDILALLLRCGESGFSAMEQLVKINNKTFGEPIPTSVFLDAWDNPGILISGHDLQDIEDLLEQTAGTGIDVYTHGDAISAHTYPALNKYFNLVANYGGAWQDQKTQFSKFNGPILVTTESIQQPKKAYQDKLFCTGSVIWPDAPYIEDRKPGQRKDFSRIIEMARETEAPTPLTKGQFLTGYGIQALTALTDKIVDAVKAEKIKHIVVILGVDGRHKERRYYSELAKTLPDKTLLLSAGDTKYRLIEHDFGHIDEIPRLLDAGQGYNFSTIISFLNILQKQLEQSELIPIPVSFNLAWYEQKTILMMLTLFALNYKNIRVGPTLPPFFTANILELLAENYGLKGIDTVESDIEAIMNEK